MSWLHRLVETMMPRPVLDPDLALGGVRLVDLEAADLRPLGTADRSPLAALLELQTNNGHGSLPDLVSSRDVQRARADTAALRDQLTALL